MGNLCSSEQDPFSKPGRPLGTAPAAPTSISVPASATKHQSARKVGGPPRTLGGGAGTGPESSSSGGQDARAKAAAAAEARLQQSKKGAGKLQAALDQRRAMTDAEALKQASETERRHRDLDQSTSALSHS